MCTFVVRNGFFSVRNILIFFSLLFSFALHSQEKVTISYLWQNLNTNQDTIILKSRFSSKIKAEEYVNSLSQILISKSYIEASVDTFFWEKNRLVVHLFLGEKYILKTIENGNITHDVLLKAKIKHFQRQIEKQKFSDLEKLKQNILLAYQNKGYPFTAVFLDSIAIHNSAFDAKIYANTYQLFTIDSIIIVGNSKTKSNFLHHYLNIKKDALYHHSSILEITKKIAQLTFIQQTKAPEVVFSENSANIYVYINKQKANQFDFLFGIAPNSSFTKSKVNFTGNGRLHLINSFGVGEEIFVDVKLLKPRTQEFTAKVNYPFLLNLPFGIAADFDLFKNDTLFLNLKSKTALHYAFHGADYVQLFYQNNTSNVLNIDTAAIRQNKTLPNVLDSRINSFGLSFHFQNLDYPINPRKGFFVTTSAMFSTKKIKENRQLQNILDDIYTQIPLRSFQYSFLLEAKYYIPLLKRHAFLIANKSSFLIAKNILQNEKYRIGGAKSLRGFDEDAIFSPYFSIFTAEYHLLLSKNTYFYTFGEFALVEDSRFHNKKIDFPYSFGLGAALETKGGILSLSYALGSQLNQKIDLRNGKIHIGYINLF